MRAPGFFVFNVNGVYFKVFIGCSIRGHSDE